ncbi:MAG: hypothetical protein ACP5OG_02415 [Candidatus Nanoarchaeia archaeon]
MKKRIIGFALVFAIIFLCLDLISARALGISPVKFRIDFEPGIQANYSINVYESDPDQRVELYATGYLSEYVSFSENFIYGSGNVQVQLKLPQYVEVPGTHVIFIGAREISEGESAGGIGGLAAVQILLEVVVPYPGEYIEAKFETTDINEGNDTYYKLEVFNLGTDDISLNSYIDIFRDNTLIKSQQVGTVDLETKSSHVFEGYLETNELKSGFYDLKVHMDYGKSLVLEDSFRIGSLFVNITDYSNTFLENRINKFYVEVENLWSSPIDGVYAKIPITSNGTLIDEITTPSVTLLPWTKTNLSGFFDASNLSSGKYLAGIKVIYPANMTYKLVYIYVNKEIIKKPVNFKLIAIIAGASTGVLILLLLITYLIIVIIRLNKLEKKINKK